MKGNKKLLALAVLLMLITVSFTTYAIYKSSATGEATVGTAAWVIKVNGSDIVTTDTFTFGASDITWNPHVSQVSGKIAPGDTGTITFEIDATGSEVNVAYDVEVGDIKIGNNVIDNDEIDVVLDPNDTGTLAYAASNMKKNVTLNVVWNAVDSTTQNPLDVDIAAETLTIPVTVTVRQNPAS
jgi:hypothetical protein